jgi:hypothetical protein
LASVAIVSVGLCGISVILWAVSQKTGVRWQAPCPGATLELGWSDESLRIGVFDHNDYRPNWGRIWGRRRGSIDNLNGGLDFFGDVNGWAIAVPFPLLIVIWAIPPLWWWLVHKDRAEHLRRVEHGLCLNCGYDARQNMSDICPECGNNPRHLVMAR